MEKAILDLYPLAQKDNTVRKPLDLFKIYQSMTTHEFSYLMEIDKMEAENILENLAHSGLVNRKKNNNGTIWKLNYSN
jgi:predicted transcriptional regulator